jgi:hypothetical protein
MSFYNSVKDGGLTPKKVRQFTALPILFEPTEILKEELESTGFLHRASPSLSRLAEDTRSQCPTPLDALNAEEDDEHTMFISPLLFRNCGISLGRFPVTTEDHQGDCSCSV